MRCRNNHQSSPYSYFGRYRCHHNTRYEAAKDAASVLLWNPSKRLKNTNCPFAMTIKVNKENSASSCKMFYRFRMESQPSSKIVTSVDIQRNIHRYNGKDRQSL